MNEETNEQEASAVLGGQNERLVMHDYILGLDGNASREDLSELIGKSFPVRDEGMSWGKIVIESDIMKVTKITADIDIESGKLSHVNIYSDYHIDGRFRFNAWTGLKSIQSYIKKYIDA